jgi:hypothetical protein
MLDELADLDSQNVRHLIEDNLVVAEIVGRAAEEAVRTASDDKRYLLAPVAAAALRGDATPGQIQALRYLERTVIALDPADLTLLVVVGTTEDGKWAQGPATPPEMQSRWPSAPDLLDPAPGFAGAAGPHWEHQLRREWNREDLDASSRRPTFSRASLD